MVTLYSACTDMIVIVSCYKQLFEKKSTFLFIWAIDLFLKLSNKFFNYFPTYSIPWIKQQHRNYLFGKLLALKRACNFKSLSDVTSTALETQIQHIIPLSVQVNAINEMSCVKPDVDLQDLAAAELGVHHVVGFVVHEVEVFLIQLGPGEEVEDGDVIRHGFQHPVDVLQVPEESVDVLYVQRSSLPVQVVVAEEDENSFVMLALEVDLAHLQLPCKLLRCHATACFDVKAWKRLELTATSVGAGDKKGSLHGHVLVVVDNQL